MERDVKFDIARCLCMFWVIGILHLTQYLGDEYYLNNTLIGKNITSAALGVFSLVSGYFIGQKYIIENLGDTKRFYIKRLIRFYPLFLLASLLLVLIGFNGWRETIISLVGLTAFVPSDYRVKTTWYMAMLLCFYAITPLVSRRNMKGLMGGGICMIISLLIFYLYYRFHGMDLKFLYNLILYYIGIIAGRNKTIFLGIINNIWLQFSGIILFAVILYFSYKFEKNLLDIASWFVGVWALLSISALLERLVARSLGWVRFIESCAYATLSYYLFHRVFYWFATQWVNLSTVQLFVYLFIFIFPLGWLVSYHIQKQYDRIVAGKK